MKRYCISYFVTGMCLACYCDTEIELTQWRMYLESRNIEYFASALTTYVAPSGELTESYRQVLVRKAIA